ncbi:MAG: hypothetical protein JNM80_10420 [Phycisphaerae bacterium]|nr:hypothetical protein [Phycisphaerae bacterium]
MNAAATIAASVTIAAGVGVGLAARSAANAHGDFSSARAVLNATLADARELARLRAAAPPAPRRPSSGLQPRLAAVLASRGLPASTLASLAPEPEAPAGPGRRAQRATLVLAPITLPHLGAVLAAWREAEPDWTATSIDLSQAGSASRDASGDLPLRAVIQLECAYAVEPDARFVTESGAAP